MPHRASGTEADYRILQLHQQLWIETCFSSLPSFRWRLYWFSQVIDASCNAITILASYSAVGGKYRNIYDFWASQSEPVMPRFRRRQGGFSSLHHHGRQLGYFLITSTFMPSICILAPDMSIDYHRWTRQYHKFPSSSTWNLVIIF